MPTPSPSRKPSLHPQHKVFSIPIPPELNPTSHKPNLEVAVASDNHSGSWDYSLVCADYGDWRWGLGDKVAEISEPGCRGKGMETYKGEYALWHEGHDWIMSRGGGWMTTMPWIRSACEGKVMIDVKLGRSSSHPDKTYTYELCVTQVEVVQSCSGCGKYEIDAEPDDKKTRWSKCSACGKTYYCSVECQRQDWKAHHKKECPTLQKDNFDTVTHGRGLRSQHGQMMVDLAEGFKGLLRKGWPAQ